MYCPNCGTQLTSGDNFCPNCGTKVTTVVNTNLTSGNMVMLVGLGDCTRSTAASLLQQICGYSPEEAMLIADNAPITIARELSEAQARFLAQALAEYGMEVSVYDGNGWRDWESTNTSVWDSAGSLITGVAAALGLIGVKNRIRRDMMHRMDFPYRFNGTRPPVYRLQNALRIAPPRRPVPAPVRPPVHHAAPPPVRPAIHPAPPPRPAPQPSRLAPSPVRPAPQPPRPVPASNARPAAPSGRPGNMPGGGPGSGGGRPGSGGGRPGGGRPGRP